MSGKFEGLSEAEWQGLEKLLPPEPATRRRGMPHVPFRLVLNTLWYLLITGCRWCDIPRGSSWAAKSSAHRWLKRWQKDGTFEVLKAGLLNLANQMDLIPLDYGAIAGSVSPGKGGGEGVAYGYKGKGVLIHSLVDGNGMPRARNSTPANASAPAQVLPLLESIHLLPTGRVGRPRERLKVLAGDHGYDSAELRPNLRTRGSRPQLPKRLWGGRRKPGRPLNTEVPRFPVERTCSWFQRKYRRLVVRWERLESCFQGFLDLAFIHLWLQRILTG